MQPILTLICLFLFLVSGNLYAEATDRYEELSGEEDDREFIGKEWQEGKASIPELPDDNAWTAVEMDALPKSQQLYLALDSVSVSKKDWVTRFWLLIRSRGGAYNAMYEAIRCGSDEFKTYAYGRKGRDPEVKLVDSAKWQDLGLRGRGNFRRELASYYICKESVPKTPEEIGQSIEGLFDSHNPWKSLLINDD